MFVVKGCNGLVHKITNASPFCNSYIDVKY
jgi:hypothetical protein